VNAYPKITTSPANAVKNPLCSWSKEISNALLRSSTSLYNAWNIIAPFFASWVLFRCCGAFFTLRKVKMQHRTPQSCRFPWCKKERGGGIMPAAPIHIFFLKTRFWALKTVFFKKHMPPYLNSTSKNGKIVSAYSKSITSLANAVKKPDLSVNNQFATSMVNCN